MKCLNRFNFGVIVGSLYLSAFIIVIILLSWRLNNLYSKDYESRDSDIVGTITIMVICFLMVFISALLIWGIIKRCHYYFIPWLTFYVIGFGVSCFFYCIYFWGVAAFHAFTVMTIMQFIMALISIFFQIVIFLFMCSLYGSIRSEYIASSNPILDNSEIGSQTPVHYTVIKDKSEM
ncbi:uncharacterized protein ACRADG_010295 isoform 3-T3 [Cochliomyia hominivorax]